MSNEVKPGQVWRWNGGGHSSPREITIKGRHKHYDGWCDTTSSDLDGMHWGDRAWKRGEMTLISDVPPADTGPQVGEVWRFAPMLNTLWQVEGELVPAGRGMEAGWPICEVGEKPRGCRMTVQEMKNGEWTRVSLAPQTAAPTGMAKCPHGCGGGWIVGSIPLMNDHLNCCPKLKAKGFVPAPAAPTGTPAKVEPPRCQGCRNAGMFPRRMVRLGYSAARIEARVWCDECHLDHEKAIRAETLAEDEMREAPKPSQPPRWWSPAIESLGAVRPFGRPRGVR